MVVILLVAPFPVNGLCASDNSKKYATYSTDQHLLLNANNHRIRDFKAYSKGASPSGQNKSNNNQRTNDNNNNNTKNFVRHITRVNISDVYSQIDLNDDTEPITKQGELILFIY